MKLFITLLLSWLIVAAGCSTHSDYRRARYEGIIHEVGDESLIIRLLDQGKPDKAHQLATRHLTFQFSDLNKLAKDTDKDQVEDGIWLAHLALKNADEHRGQLIHDKYSLQMVIACKALVTDPADIQRALELEKYLATSSTNQVLNSTP